MWLVIPVLLMLAAATVAFLPPAYPEREPRRSRSRAPAWVAVAVPLTTVIGVVVVAAIALG